MIRALGIDLGEARIGLAISDELGMLAHPLETIHLKHVADPLGPGVARNRITNMDGLKKRHSLHRNRDYPRFGDFGCQNGAAQVHL